MIEVSADRSKFKARLMEHLIGKGLAWALADAVSNASIDAIWREWAGSRVYFSKGLKRKADPDQVWEQFTGRNHEALAKTFKCTVRRIEQIVAAKTAALHAGNPR